MAPVGHLIGEGKLLMAGSRPAVATDYASWLVARRDAGSPPLQAVPDSIMAEATGAKASPPI